MESTSFSSSKVLKLYLYQTDTVNSTTDVFFGEDIVFFGYSKREAAEFFFKNMMQLLVLKMTNQKGGKTPMKKKGKR